ncbi:MAG: molybdopterin-guanine dinucleotide biosynthesis protein MobB [Desulfotignum sp.]
MNKKILQIIRHPDAGKITLVVDLVRELTNSHFRAGTIKHTALSYERDRPGKDSFSNRNKENYKIISY